MRRLSLSGLRSFAVANAMPLVSVAAALATCVAVPPDAAYAGYVDWATLGRLACVLAVVAGLRDAGAFQALAAALAGRCHTARALVGALVGITALASMFVTNDMALVALLPLSAAALLAVERPDLVARTFVLQGVAANLCGMLLPFGNPQNIYLAGVYRIAPGSFVAAMAPPFAVSAALLALCCLTATTSAPVRVEGVSPSVSPRRTAVLALLLAVCVGSVAGAVPVLAAVAVVFGALVELDARMVARADWGLVVTFAAFFVFSGNLARMEAVREVFSAALSQGAFLPAALLSQVVSNVPAAVVLSQFTGDWRGLLAGVNVGGAGTPVASLATLIVIAQYRVLVRARVVRRGRFFALLAGVNAAFLLVLLAMGILMGW